MRWANWSWWVVKSYKAAGFEERKSVDGGFVLEFGSVFAVMALLSDGVRSWLGCMNCIAYRWASE